MTFTEAISRWGKRAVQRILDMTKKHGVVCSQTVWVNEDNTKG